MHINSNNSSPSRRLHRSTAWCRDRSGRGHYSYSGTLKHTNNIHINNEQTCILIVIIVLHPEGLTEALLGIGIAVTMATTVILAH